jgi:hypothetical protein
MEAIFRLLQIAFSMACGAILAAGLLYWRYPEYRYLVLKVFAGKREIIPEDAAWDSFFGLDFGKCTEADLQRCNLELEKLILKRSYQPSLDLARLYYLQFQADTFLRTRDRIIPGISKATKQQRKAQQSVPDSTDWREVLGVPKTENNPALIKRAYRQMAARHHPDRGGDDRVMGRLNRAYKQAKQELGFV